MTQKATTKDQLLAANTRNGQFDTDNGGRQPDVREAMRQDWYGLAALASADREHLDLLPLHDLVMIQRLAAIVAANAAELTIVRLQQSGNETAFRSKQ